MFLNLPNGTVWTAAAVWQSEPLVLYQPDKIQVQSISDSCGAAKCIKILGHVISVDARSRVLEGMMRILHDQ